MKKKIALKRTWVNQTSTGCAKTFYDVETINLN